MPILDLFLKRFLYYLFCLKFLKLILELSNNVLHKQAGHISELATTKNQKNGTLIFRQLLNNKF